MERIVYLTGAPATGKSTITQKVRQHIPNLIVFSYAERLVDHMKAKGRHLSHADLRDESANSITRQDIETLDAELISLSMKCRQDAIPLLIDSHPVTIEDYGFRVTMFSKEVLKAISPNVIVCLYADAAVLSERIKHVGLGRKFRTIADVDRHVNLQNQVAAIYALETAASLYYLDAARPELDVYTDFIRSTKLHSCTN